MRVKQVQQAARQTWGGEALPGMGRKVIDKSGDARDTGGVLIVSHCILFGRR